MATAKRLPSGNWQVKVYSHTEYVDGKPKRIRESFTAPTKAEAEYQAALFKRQNKRKNTCDLSLGDALEGYINSKDGILCTVNNPWILSDQENISAEPADYAALPHHKPGYPNRIEQEKKAHNLSAKTIKNISGLVSAAIGLYREDFHYKVTLPEKERYDYYLPTQNDISVLLAHTEGKELHTAILLAACLGLRRGEICALEWRDFDWKQKTVRINKAVVLTEEDTWKTKNPKSYAGNRVLSLSDGLIRELEKIKSTGKVIAATPTQISHRFQRAMWATGLEHFRFHDLRHFNASLMMSEGIPDKYAVERMGHSTTAILKSVYQHTENKKRNETTQ